MCIRDRKYGVNDIVQFLNDVEKTTIGMDEWVQRLAAQHTSERTSYPPYNLVKESNTDFKLEIALAGYNRKDIDVYSELNKLVVEAKKGDDDDSEYVHRGLARRAFTRTWTLSDDVKIAKDYIHTIKKIKIKNKINDLRLILKQSETKDYKVDEILMEMNDLRNKLNENYS